MWLLYAPFSPDRPALRQSVSDNCSSLSVGDVVIEKAPSDEPDNAPGPLDGNTTNDIVIAGDCKSAQLRSAEALSIILPMQFPSSNLWLRFLCCFT